MDGRPCWCEVEFGEVMAVDGRKSCPCKPHTRVKDETAQVDAGAAGFWAAMDVRQRGFRRRQLSTRADMRSDWEACGWQG